MSRKWNFAARLITVECPTPSTDSSYRYTSFQDIHLRRLSAMQNRWETFLKKCPLCLNPEYTENMSSELSHRYSCQTFLGTFSLFFILVALAFIATDSSGNSHTLSYFMAGYGCFMLFVFFISCWIFKADVKEHYIWVNSTFMPEEDMFDKCYFTKV